MGVFAEYLHRGDVNKGGGKIYAADGLIPTRATRCPDYRSRFVGKEFNVGVDPELYAATPSLEALKLLLVHASANKHRGIHAT